MEVGYLIKQLREEAGMEKLELAEKSGVSISTVHNLEAGKYAASMYNVQALCKGLNIPFFYFMFLAMKEEDVPDNRKGFFNVIKPVVMGLYSK